MFSGIVHLLVAVVLLMEIVTRTTRLHKINGLVISISCILLVSYVFIGISEVKTHA